MPSRLKFGLTPISHSMICCVPPKQANSQWVSINRKMGQALYFVWETQNSPRYRRLEHGLLHLRYGLCQEILHDLCHLLKHSENGRQIARDGGNWAYYDNEFRKLRQAIIVRWGMFHTELAHGALHSKKRGSDFPRPFRAKLAFFSWTTVQCHRQIPSRHPPQGYLLQIPHCQNPL